MQPNVSISHQSGIALPLTNQDEAQKPVNIDQQRDVMVS